MSLIVQAFIAGLFIVFLIQLATGYVADKSYKVLAVQPLIALMWVIGTTSVVKGVGPSLSYILGSTIGAGFAMWIRRREKEIL